MKKFVFLSCLAALLCINVSSAQGIFDNPAYTKKEISLSVNSSVVTGPRSLFYSNAFGMDGMLYYQIEKTTYVGIGAGFQVLNIRPDQITNVVRSITSLPIDAFSFVAVLPVYAGIRHDLTAEGFQPYIGVDVGTSIMSLFVFVSNRTSDESASSTDLGFDTQISIMPKVGFRLPATKSLLLDAHLRYNHFATSIFDYTLFSSYYMGLVSANVGLTYLME